MSTQITTVTAPVVTEPNPILVAALRQVTMNNGVETFTYDKDIVDALVLDFERKLRVATMPTDVSTGITGPQSDMLVSLIQVYVQAAIDNSWAGAGDPAAIPELQQDQQNANEELNKFITLLRAPV